jgi:hypothetical protein
LTNGTASNLKVFAHQRKQLPESRVDPQNGGKIFVRYLTDKGLISRIYKEIKKLNSKRTNNPSNKWKNELNREFSEEKGQILINT